MAFRVEVEQRRWWQRPWVLWLVALGVIGLDAAIVVPNLERHRASQVVANQAVPEVTLSCGGEKEYQRLPKVKKVVVIVKPTGKNCWTAWLRGPENTRFVRLDPDSDIDSEMAFGEGKIEKRHDSPLSEWSNGRVMNAVRYQNPDSKPVRISITISR